MELRKELNDEGKNEDYFHLQERSTKSWEENVEIVSLNADQELTSETSFSYHTKTPQKQPVPPPRKKPPSGDINARSNKALTNEADTSQRLAPPPQDQVSRGSVNARRQSVGGWSVGSVNSQSDSRSYRERLRERIQTVKEQAGSSVITAKTRVKQHLKIRSSYLDLLGREENEVAVAIEKHEEIRKKWTHVAHATLEAEAAHNFFTKEWEPDQCSEELPVKSNIEDYNDDEQVKLVTKDYLGLPEEWQAASVFVEPTVDDTSLKVHQENQLYYYPSNQRVTLEEKLGPNKQPRYIEEEGLYVGTKPQWSTKSYNKLQQRLLKEGRRHWFGEDGELKTNLDSNQSNQYNDPLLVPVYRNAEIMKISEPVVRHESLPQVTYLLELEVARISWTHHPLFSREHVAARRVLSLFQEYSGRVKAGLGRRLAHKLQALRKSRDNAKRGGDTDLFMRYKTQVRETRELRMEEGRKDRAAVVNCLKAWLELRTLRTEQGYSVTPVRLNIVEMDHERTNLLFGIANEWTTELKSQVSERIEEEEEKYAKTLEELKKTQESTEAAGGELRDISKVSHSEILEEVKQKLSESLTPPGEPVISLELADEQTTPEAEITDQRELERRAAHKRCLLNIRVLYNKHTVCQSRALPLYPHFTTAFNERFSLQVSDWPQSLSLELTIEGGIGHGKCISASVYIPVPSRTTTVTGVPLDQLEFNTPAKLGPYTHAAVGCGLPGMLYAGGHVFCRVGWGDHGAPPHKPYNTSCRTPRKLLNNVGSMREWVARAHLDPNDPSNADLFEYIKGEHGTNDNLSSDPKDELQDGDFCTMEDIENNSRLKLLNLRSQMVPEFREIRNIPLKDREIPDDIFKLYEKRIECRVRSGPGVGETAIEWQREWSRQQLDLMRDNIVQHCRQTQQQCSLREVILEDQVPDMGMLGLTFMKWLQPKRPLRPTRKERKKLPVMGLIGQEVEVIVNVVRAFEVPVRVDIDPLLDNDMSLVPVRPFVEVSFQNRKSRTTTAGGANPTWNQDLRIPVKLPSTGLHQVQDKLYCQLYDETVVDLLEDDRKRETNIHQRLQRQWLGSLQIPFTSLCSNSRIEGTFQLYSPPVLLGYERESQHRQSNSSGLRDSTFLTLFITVHPPLHPPQPLKERLPCSEMPFLEQHLEEWQSQFASQFPHRPLKCLVVDTSAKSVCVTRFFRPLAPPVLEEEETTTPEMALRFVSKIPVVPGNTLFPGLFDIWLTAQQVLTLLSGDAEDHAVLLCCYLMYLGMKAWLLLGSGVPHGPMALVLTRDLSGACTLWDPLTGQQFNIQDSFCPLHRVYCLINQDNIWANIQREEVVSRTRFDVTKRGDWWPAFNRNVAAPMDSVQPVELEYVVSPTLKTDVALLQDKLEKILRDSITKWRPTTRTIWNRYVTVKLRKLLPGMEKMAGSSNVLSSTEHINQLSQMLSSHKMCGFTQNFAFTSTEEIVEAVKATGIHTSEDSDVEFALAVYVHPFVCGVLSIWIYVTSLIVRR